MQNIKIGDKIGKLTVLSDSIYYKRNGERWTWKHKCLCDCGKKCFATTYQLRDSGKGKKRSCGCMVKSNKEYTIDDLARDKIRYIKHSAKDRNLIYNLPNDLATLLVRAPCFYCGYLPKHKNARYRNNRTKLFINGIDRINSSIGYTIVNSVSCCYRCNLAKHTMSIDGFIKLIKRIHSHLDLSNSINIIDLAAS